MRNLDILKDTLNSLIDINNETIDKNKKDFSRKINYIMLENQSENFQTVINIIDQMKRVNKLMEDKYEEN